MLDRRDLLDAEPDGGLRSGPGRNSIGDVRGGPDRFARHDDEPGVELRVVDDDRLEAVADLESDALAPVLERDPAGVAMQLETGPPEDERAVRVVLELVLGVDTAAHPDVSRGAVRERESLAHTHLRRRGQKTTDTVARPVGAEDQHARRERDDAGDERDEGGHGGDDTRRTRKGPKKPPRHMGLEAISAVSVARPLRAG